MNHSQGYLWGRLVGEAREADCCRRLLRWSPEVWSAMACPPCAAGEFALWRSSRWSRPQLRPRRSRRSPPSAGPTRCPTGWPGRVAGVPEGVGAEASPRRWPGHRQPPCPPRCRSTRRPSRGRCQPHRRERRLVAHFGEHVRNGVRHLPRRLRPPSHPRARPIPRRSGTRRRTRMPLAARPAWRPGSVPIVRYPVHSERGHRHSEEHDAPPVPQRVRHGDELRPVAEFGEEHHAEAEECGCEHRGSRPPGVRFAGRVARQYVGPTVGGYSPSLMVSGYRAGAAGTGTVVKFGCPHSRIRSR